MVFPFTLDCGEKSIKVENLRKELQRLEKRIEKLIKENEWGELALSYSILSDICKLKVVQVLEDEDNVDFDEVNKWKLKAEEYKRREKDALLQLDTLELEKGIRTDEESLFSEHDVTILVFLNFK